MDNNKQELLVFSMIIIYGMEVDRVKELHNITDNDIINIIKKYESYSDEKHKNIVLY